MLTSSTCGDSQNCGNGLENRTNTNSALLRLIKWASVLVRVALYIGPYAAADETEQAEHACPGRFFASNEIKIALCILILEYDFEYVPGDDPPKDINHEIVRLSDPSARMRIRKREGDI